jgi:hypothetical protein
MEAVLPSAKRGAVPETAITFPILTAREKPMRFSKGEPDETFLRCIITSYAFY